MRLFVRHALVVTLLCSGACFGLCRGGAAAEGADQDMLQADRAFVQAIAKADTRGLGKLLDTDFLWIDSDGKALTRTQVLQTLPRPGFSDESTAQLKNYTYEDVGDVQANLGRVHTLRVWVKRPIGWRAIVYQEVVSLDAPPSFAPGAGKDCDNPCKSVSYKPKNEVEKQVVSAYERLETAAMAHDSARFSALVADEFVAASSNSNKVYDKRGRMEDFDHAKMAGVAPTPLASARMFDFKEAVVMTSFHRPDQGKPLRVTRVWVNRDGKWIEALSYQTSVTP
jgi:uncharacterized protein DUF4440